MYRNAFTLIELLVTIAIVAILLGVIISALRQVKYHAKSVICSSNQAQIGLKLNIYNNDHRSLPYGFDDQKTTVPPGGTVGNLVNDRFGWWWFHFIQDSFDKKSDLWCPSRNLADPETKRNLLCGNYGINRSICKDSSGSVGVSGNEFAGKPLSVSQIRQPWQVMLLTDSGYSQISWKAATDSISPHFDNPKREKNFYIPGMKININRRFTTKPYPEVLDGRHPQKKINVLFADGHLENIKADKVTVSVVKSKYRNISYWKP